MARTRTLTNLIADVRYITDTGGATGFHPDANITRAINQGIARLWALLVQTDPLRHLAATVDSITTTAGTKTYTLNTDFYAAVHVSRVSGSDRYTLHRFNMGELDSFRSSGASAGGYASHYTIVKQGIDGTGGKIWFEPDPGSTTYELEYIQQPQELSGGTDKFDGVAGWEEYVVAYAARAVMIREEQFDNVQFWTMELERLKKEIESESAVRDAGAPPTTARIWSGGEHPPYP